jgi:hypothetical protein
MLIPDGSQVEIQREKNLTSDNTLKITLSFEVQTYYPAFRKPNLRDLETGRFFGNYPWSNVNSSLSNSYNGNGIPGTNGPGSTVTGAFGQPGGGGAGGPGGPGGPGGGGPIFPNSDERSDILLSPKRTKWYVNLRELTGRGNARETNENNDDNINSQN